MDGDTFTCKAKDFFVVHHIGVLLVFYSHTFVCQLYFTMEFLPIYGLAYSSVTVAGFYRAAGWFSAIYARTKPITQRSLFYEYSHALFEG